MHRVLHKFRPRKVGYFLPIAVATLVTCSAVKNFAQDAFGSAARQQAQNFSQPATAAPRVNSDGMALPNDATDADKEADADLGEQWVLRRNERILRFNIFADVSAFHTTNVALAHTNAEADSFLVGTIGASYSHPVFGSAVGNVSLGESIFRYNRFAEFDFDSFSATAGVSMPIKRLWDANVSLQYSFNRLTQDPISSELFSGHSIALSATKSIQLSTADSVSFGASAAYNLADPSTLDRADVSVFGGYFISLTRQLSVSLNYRASFFDYPNDGRTDLNQTLAASVRFDVNRWFSLNLSSSGVLNDSSARVFDYKALNLGGGLAGNIRF